MSAQASAQTLGCGSCAFTSLKQPAAMDPSSGPIPSIPALPTFLALSASTMQGTSLGSGNGTRMRIWNSQFCTKKSSPGSGRGAGFP